MERLWEIIEKEKIRIEYEDLIHTPEGLHALYMYNHKIGPVVVLGKHLVHNRRLFKCVLSEEIGHYRTAPRTNLLIAYTSANLQTMQSQDEQRALRQATDFLIPDRELVKALDEGYRSCYELAEYFDVTEWFMYRKMGFLKACFRRTGLKVKGRDLFECEMQPCNLI